MPSHDFLIGYGAAKADTIADIVAAGEEQIQAIEDKGEEVRDSLPSDYTELTDEVSDLKSSITNLEGGTTGQVLRKKSGTDFDVEWASVAQPTDEQVDTAVNDWLDDHPEATTTVQDGSLTEAKLTDATQLKVLNDYVTPEMFGAIGDGTTDDTQALQDMFDSGRNVHFPNKAYATTGVLIPSAINVTFTDTEFNALTNYQDYVINVSARVTFVGKLYINGKYKALNGIKFSSGTNESAIEYLKVVNCKAWGVLIAASHITFEYIYTMECGSRIQLTISKVSAYVASISGTVSANNKELLKTAYINNIFMLVDSGYTDTTYPGPYMRKVASGYDEENSTLHFVEQNINALPNNFNDVAISICYGGGVFINEGVNSQISFGIVDTRLGTVGIGFGATYGHNIGNFYSQSDRLPIAVYNYSLGNYIGSITAEGSKSGYVILSYYYDYSVIVTKSTGYGDNFLSSQICSQVSQSKPTVNALHLKNLRRVLPFWYNAGETYTIDEWKPDTTFLRNKNKVYVGIRDNYSDNNSYNYWGVKTVYFMPSSAQSNDIVIELTNAAKSNGYSISGGTDGVLTFARPSSTAWFKIEIFLFSKVFYVTMSELTEVTPIT